MKYRKIKYNPYRVKGNTLGNPYGNIVIELYSDYVCPLCYMHNIMLHQAAKEFFNIKIIHHNYPFDRQCNSYLSINMHPGACNMAKVAIAAKKQGNYWEMASLLYENQPKNIEDVVKLAQIAGLNETQLLQDMRSKETYEELQKDILDGVSKEIDSTPTMFINGKKIVGVKPYYELKELLIENGACKK